MTLDSGKHAEQCQWFWRMALKAAIRAIANPVPDKGGQ